MTSLLLAPRVLIAYITLITHYHIPSSFVPIVSPAKRIESLATLGEAHMYSVSPVKLVAGFSFVTFGS